MEMGDGLMDEEFEKSFITPVRPHRKRRVSYLDKLKKVLFLHSHNHQHLLSYLTFTIMMMVLFSVNGQDEFMTCSRPTKSSRAGRTRFQSPCEGMESGSQSYCTLPGPAYPWHAVRRFVFENQGLMRRMYGEVRQVSLLRMEFAGETNSIEEGRDFDDIFKPLTQSHMTHNGPSATLSSFLASSTSAGPSPGHPYDLESQTEQEFLESGSGVGTGRTSLLGLGLDFEEGHGDDELGLFTTLQDFTTTPEPVSASSPSSTASSNGQAEPGLNISPPGNLVVSTSENPETEPLPNDPTSNTATPASSNPDKNEMDPPERLTSNDDPNLSYGESSPGIKGQGDAEEPPAGEQDKNRLEGQVLFQDFEKFLSPTSSSSTTEEPRIKTNRPGVNACPVKEEVVAPYWANTTRGETLALLNLYPFEQYIHWEKCTNEHRQMYCRDGCRCEQQYRLHRLLAFDPQNECRGIFSDWFRFPSCCVCKCYFDELLPPERLSFNRSPRIIIGDAGGSAIPGPIGGRGLGGGGGGGGGRPLGVAGGPRGRKVIDLDGPDVNGVDDSHFYYKYSSFRQPRK